MISPDLDMVSIIKKRNRRAFSSTMGGKEEVKNIIYTF